MMKKGKWSKEEDNLIKNHIEKYGIGRSWQALSNTLGLQRCGRSCRSRWLNYLRPGLKHGNFTPAEERIICEMYSKRGSCWSVIAAQLPGRTDLAIKNYWNSTLKKKFPAARTSAAAARRRRDRPACSTSSDAGSPARDLELIAYSSEEESSTAGPLFAGPTPVKAVKPPVPVAGGGQEPIAAVTVSGPVRIEKKEAVEKKPPPPAACDQTGERVMDIVCVPMSPVPLSFMEPEEELACIYQFDEIDSFLPWFDHH
ncbi:unnamed protein product [Urochloa decumbens]|uniref:Uncharacterized protein n=1 Tax=Urochloa decumbens TaxID=240449 RepID=A0ABC8XH54_9POAL